MMKYEVLTPFRDLEDITKKFPDGRLFAVGDNFPFAKQKVSDERIKELSTKENKLKRPVIKIIKDDA